MSDLLQRFINDKAEEIKQKREELIIIAKSKNRNREDFFIFMMVDADSFDIVQSLDMGHTENDEIQFF